MIPTPQQIIEAFRRGLDTRDIANAYGCSESDVYNRLSLVWSLKRGRAA